MRRRAVGAMFGMCGVILLLLALSGAGEPSGALPACPGPDLVAEKPGAPPSPETRFFQELQRLDGLLVRGQVLQGCLLNERFRFEVETGEGPQGWEAPAGDVVGYLPARGDAPRVLVRTEAGFELRAGRLTSPLRVRLGLGEPVELALDPEGVTFFLLRGVYGELPLPLQARVLQGLIPAFQRLRTQAELIITQTAGVLAGEVLLEAFSVEREDGRAQRVPRAQLRRLRVQDGAARRVELVLRDGRTLVGVIEQRALPVRVLSVELRVPWTALQEVLFRDRTLRFRGGGGRVRFCPEEPC